MNMITNCTSFNSYYETYETLTKRLPNGISYCIVPNVSMGNAAQISVTLKVGSLCEEEGQEGFAHLLEHVAFFGTESFTREQIVSIFWQLGIKLGDDSNAKTTIDHTNYFFTIPTDHEPQIELIIKVLYEMIFRMKISSEQLIQERKVVLSELLQMTLNKDAPVDSLFTQTLFGRRVTAIGKADTLENCTLEKLLAFKEKWYTHPHLVHIAVVGNVNIHNVDGFIQKHFGQAETPRSRLGQMQEPPSPHWIEHELSSHPTVEVVTHKACYPTQFSIMAISGYTSAHEGGISEAEALEQLAVDAYSVALKILIARQSSQPNSAIKVVHEATGYFPGKKFCIRRDIHPLLSQAIPALIEFLAIHHRLEEQGLSDEDLKFVQGHLLSEAPETIDSAQICANMVKTNIMNHFLYRAEGLTHNSNIQKYKRLIPQLSNEILQAQARRFSIHRSFLYALVPEKASLERDHLLEAFCQATKMTLDVSSSLSTFNLSNRAFPPPGTVKEMQPLPKIGAVEWVLSNGLKVTYLKKSSQEMTSVVSLMIAAPRGIAHMSPKKRCAFRIASDLASLTGFEGATHQDLQQLFLGKRLTLPQVVISYDSMHIEASVQGDLLEDLLKILHLKMCERQCSEFKSQFSRAFDMRSEKLLNVSGDNFLPRQRLQKIVDVITSDHSVAATCSFDEAKTISLEELTGAYSAIMESILSQGNVTLVGDIESDIVLELTLKYLANLPILPEAQPFPTELNIPFPATNLTQILYDQSEPKIGIAYLLFKLPQGSEYPLHINQLAVQIVQDHINCLLRDQRRDVYSIFMKQLFNMRHPYNYNIQSFIIINTPDTIQEMTDQSYQSLKEITAPAYRVKLEEILASCKDKMKSTLRRHFEQPNLNTEQKNTLYWPLWHSYLQNCYREGHPRDDIEADLNTDLTKITADEISHFIQTYFTNAPKVTFFSLPKKNPMDH